MKDCLEKLACGKVSAIGASSIIDAFPRVIMLAREALGECPHCRTVLIGRCQHCDTLHPKACCWCSDCPCPECNADG